MKSGMRMCSGSESHSLDAEKGKRRVDLEHWEQSETQCDPNNWFCWWRQINNSISCLWSLKSATQFLLLDKVGLSSSHRHFDPKTASGFSSVCCQNPFDPDCNVSPVVYSGTPWHDSTSTLRRKSNTWSWRRRRGIIFHWKERKSSNKLTAVTGSIRMRINLNQGDAFYWGFFPNHIKAVLRRFPHRTKQEQWQGKPPRWLGTSSWPSLWRVESSALTGWGEDGNTRGKKEKRDQTALFCGYMNADPQKRHLWWNRSPLAWVMSPEFRSWHVVLIQRLWGLGSPTPELVVIAWQWVPQTVVVFYISVV